MTKWRKADRLHPLIPRESKRFKQLYRSRNAVEREFGRLKHEWALLPLRVRGIDRVRHHADLTILAKLACRLSAERSVTLVALVVGCAIRSCGRSPPAEQKSL
jgi:Transposase DDE domain